MILLPHDTSYGKILNTVEIKKELLKYLISTTNTNLNYEYAQSNIKLVIITGFCMEEKNIPIFDLPIIVEDLKKNKIMCIDLRKYVKPHTEQVLDLKDIIKDKSTLDFIMLQALLTIEFLNENYGVIAPIEKNLVSAYSLLISGTAMHIANFTPVEKINVEIITSYYFLNQLIEDKYREDSKASIAAKIMRSTLSLPTNMTLINNAIQNVNVNAITLSDLMDDIKKVVSSDKQELINDQVIINNVSSMWYGPGGSDNMIIGLEHVPTFAALLYSAGVDKTFKRSRLAMLFDKSSNKIKITDVEKFIKLYLMDKTL